MKKKTISLLMAASLAASSLAGGIVSFAGGSPIRLHPFWYGLPFTGSDGDVLREIIDNYNETNTDNITVQIDIMDNATLQSKLPTAVSTGTGPSFVLVGIEFLQQYAKNGLIEDISDFWDVTGIDKSNFYENVLAKSYVGDTQYGVPMQYNLQYLYYNKDIFEAAGLDPETPPTTLDELKEQQSVLLAIEDGVVCADRDGTLASVTYEAGDTLIKNTAFASYYDLDTILISVEVSQNNIAKLAVGDTVQVQISGSRMGAIDGTVYSIASEKTSGGSMSNVTYAVIVAVDNTDGTLTTGVQATVKFETQATGATEMEETKTAGKTETIGASETEEAGGKTE